MALRNSIDENWSKASEKNPKLFDGSIVAPAKLSWGSTVPCLDWYESHYAHFLYSQAAKGIEGLVGSLFVSVVLPTERAEIVIGRMAPATSFPGLLQLPGGGVEVPDAPNLTLETVLESASRELYEEVGVILPAHSFNIVGIIVRSQPLDVGIVVTTAPIGKQEIEEAFERLHSRVGDAAELTELVFASAAAPLPAGDKADYLDTVLESLRKSASSQ